MLKIEVLSGDRRMPKKILSGVLPVLIVTAMLISAFNIEPANGSGTIYIRGDGSVDPSTTPLHRDGNTYTFLNDIYDSIVVERDNITIDGAKYTLQGAGTHNSRGIFLYGRSNITIRNLTVKMFYIGIYVYQSSNCSFSKSEIISNKWIGIFLDGSRNVTIENCTTSDNRGSQVTKFCFGIHLKYSSYCTVKDCIMHDDAWNGVNIGRGSSNNIIRDCTFYGNTDTAVDISGWDGPPPSNNLVENCTIHDVRSDGIYLYTCENNIVRNSRIFNCPLHGILVGELDRPAKTYNNTIADCVIYNTFRGITIWYGPSNNRIQNCAIFGSIHQGINIEDGANSNVIEKCRIYDNGLPDIRICDFSNNNVLNDNTISGGVGVENGSVQNTIYNNNFLSNGTAVSIDAINNWDGGYPSGGNYWSDYTGVDLFRGSCQNETGSDGIGDKAYIINENNIDHYPLMKPKNLELLKTDLNMDGRVNILDITLVATAYNSREGDPKWNKLADLDNSGLVNILDISMVAKDYGKTV